MAGIMFQDITTLLLDTQAFKDTIDLFVERYKDKEISVVAGKFNLKSQNMLFHLYQVYDFTRITSSFTQC